MEGFYPRIFKQAFHLAKGHKLFWLAGLFLAWPFLFRALLLLVLFAPAGFRQYLRSGAPEQGLPASPWLGLLAAIVGLLLFIYYFRNKAALIAGVKVLRTRSALEPAQFYSQAVAQAPALARISVAALLLVFGAAAILTAPALESSPGSAGFAAFAAAAGLAYLPFFVFVYLLSVLASLFSAAYELPLPKTLAASMDLLKRRLPVLLAMAFLLLCADILFLAAGAFLAALASLPFVLFSGIIYDMEGPNGPALTLAAGVVFVVFFISQAAAAAFKQIAWTVAFLEITRAAKTQEPPAAATVPEAAQT